MVRALIRENAVACGWREFTGSNGVFSRADVVRGQQRLEYLDRFPEIRQKLNFVLRGTAEFERQHVPAAGGVELQFDAATLWPYKLVAWVFESLVKKFGGVEGRVGSELGFNLQTNTPVVHLQRVDGGWMVYTERGQILAKQVLVATNGYTSRLLPEFTNVIVPTQGQVVALEAEVDGEKVKLEHTYGFWGSEEAKDNKASTALALAEGNVPIQTDVMPAERDDYLAQSQLAGQELVYGGGRRFADGAGWGVSCDARIDPAVSRFLRSDLLSGSSLDLRALKSDAHGKTSGSMKAHMEWTGIMGYSRDWLPWVGPVSEQMGGGEGLWVCGGYTGHGMPVAPLSAVAVVGLMGGSRLEEVDVPKEFYSARDGRWDGC